MLINLEYCIKKYQTTTYFKYKRTDYIFIKYNLNILY